MVLTTVIANGIVEGNAKDLGKNSTYYEQTGELAKYQKYDENGKPIAMSQNYKDLLSYGLDNKGAEGWGLSLANAYNIVGEYKSNPLMGWGVSRKDRNQAAFEKTIASLGADPSLSETDMPKAILAWLMIADASGVISDIDNWDTNKIKSLYKEVYENDEEASTWVTKLTKWGNFTNPQMGTKWGQTLEYKYPTNFDKYHRSGLAEVPYDNYKAVLHEGEAVLTASTANELRNLLDEYRANRQMSADIETAIQSQTYELVAKLDEVIGALSNLNVGGTVTTSSLDQQTARNRLRYSMTHMVSTKDALS